MSKEIVIYQEWGGLGDNLAHTTIPRLCHDHGYKCYLSRSNAINNPEIYSLLWENCEYIHGWSDVVSDKWKTNYAEKNEPGWNHLRHIQVGYGFDEAPYMYPVISYIPNFIPELEDKTLVDLSGDHCYRYFPQFFNTENITQIYYNLIKTLGVMNDDVRTLVMRPINYTSYGTTDVNIPSMLNFGSLFDYCDALYSCKRFIGIDSGPGNLASCIKNQFNTNCEIYILGMSFQLPPKKSDTYHYPNTNYISTDTGDVLKAGTGEFITAN
tara:strand:+ start:8684 stop:9487 length:804 start_codon:yes stop_codon:yes gene_type:complete